MIAEFTIPGEPCGKGRPRIIVFNIGAKCRITSPVSLVPEVSEGFVYAVHDVSMNKIFIRCSETEPTGDFVMLGKISDNTVTPARTFAYGKTAAVTGNASQTIELPKTIAVTETETLRLSIPMEGVGYNIMILTRPEESTTQHCNFFAVFDISKGKFIFRSSKDDGFDAAESDRLIVDMSSPWAKYSVARFAAEDGNINVYTYHNPTSSSYADNDDFGYTVNFY